MSFTKKELTELKLKFLDRMSVIGSATVVARELGINLNTGRAWVRSAGMTSRRVSHPRQAEYLALRNTGHTQVSAADQVGVNVRTCQDWEHGTRRSRGSRFYADGRRVNYVTGETTIESMSPLPSFAGIAAL